MKFKVLLFICVVFTTFTFGQKKFSDDSNLCYPDRVKLLFAENFNQKLLTKHQGLGIVRAYTRFTIGTSGKLEDIRINTNHKFIRKEIKRILKMIPLVKVTTDDGEPAKLTYTIPFVIEF